MKSKSPSRNPSKDKLVEDNPPYNITYISLKLSVQRIPPTRLNFIEFMFVVSGLVVLFSYSIHRRWFKSVTPWKINMLNPKSRSWMLQMIFLFNCLIFRIQLDLQGCMKPTSSWILGGRILFSFQTSGSSLVASPAKRSVYWNDFSDATGECKAYMSSRSHCLFEWQTLHMLGNTFVDYHQNFPINQVSHRIKSASKSPQ